MKLAIVIGHTQKSPGAFAAPPLRLSEYDYNTEVARIVYRLAMGRGVKAKIFTRDGVGVKGVYKLVNEWSASSIYEKTVCVELHFNCFNGKVQGTETLFDMQPPESVEFAREVHDMICSVFERKGKTNRGLKTLNPGDRGYENEHECQITACLVEPFFGDHKDDAQMAMEKQTEYAEAIVDGVINYFKNSEKRMALN